MKKILFIAKINDVAKNLHNAMTQYFNVQMSSPNYDVIKGMLEVFDPDLVVILLIGAYEIDEGIFEELARKYMDVPVVTVGSESEKSRFNNYYRYGQFENVLRPTENEVVLKCVAGKLGVVLSEAQLHADAVVGNIMAGASGKKSVLIVDDNAATLRSLKSILENNYDVSIANSGTKAMTMIGKKRPDCILLDYEMPVLDGRQTLEMIRSEEDLADIPVIFLTGVDDRQHIQAVLALRPAGYMLKPANQGKLMEAIDKAISEAPRKEM